MTTPTGTPERRSSARGGSLGAERESLASGRDSVGSERAAGDLETRDGRDAPRLLALLGVALLTASYCSTLYWVTTVAGGTTMFVAAIAVGIGLGVVLRGTEERTIVWIGGGGAATAVAWYSTTAVPTIDLDMALRVVGNSLVMVSGISVLELAAVDVWIAALVPVPVFLSTYFALRGRYGFAAVSGCWLVVFLALTGDATVVETLLGAVGAATTVGFGELDRRDGSLSAASLLVVLVAAMAILAVAVPMVPSGSTDDFEPAGLGPTAASSGDQAQVTPLDEQLLSGNEATPGGPIELSPETRFVVESPSRHRWRVGSLGTYTGDGWTWTGTTTPYRDALEGPRGSSQTVEQSYDLRAPADDVPAVAYPVDVRNLETRNLRVTSTGALTVEDRLAAGTNYAVQSRVPTPSASDLRTAGTDYPTTVEQRYTALPEDTVPERVESLTDEVTSEASNPYETARAIESYLESEKGYSQDVSAPDSTLADGFLFEMDAGYCTYFAGTMATMLRTQGIPARVAVGYSSGQYVGNDTWVVRGTDAHAWVEVYFADVGWIEFDPTPTTAVRDARRDTIQTARENDSDRVDVPESTGEDVRFEQPEDPSDDEQSGEEETNGTDDSTDGDTGGSTPVNESPPDSAYSGIGYSFGENASSANFVQPDAAEFAGPGASGPASNDALAERTGDRLLDGLGTTVIALLLIAGTVAGGRRAGLKRRLHYAGSVLWQRRRDPETDVRRAIARLDAVLERRYGARRPGETRREYRRRLPRTVDADVHRAFELYERARYGGEIDRARADEFVDVVDRVARRDLPVVGRG